MASLFQLKLCVGFACILKSSILQPIHNVYRNSNYDKTVLNNQIHLNIQLAHLNKTSDSFKLSVINCCYSADSWNVNLIVEEKASSIKLPKHSQSNKAFALETTIILLVRKCKHIKTLPWEFHQKMILAIQYKMAILLPFW